MISIGTGVNDKKNLYPFDVYQKISEKFKTINTFDSFLKYTLLHPNELVSISTIVTESLESLRTCSEFFTKKINDDISTIFYERLEKMFQLHNELIDRIHIFSEISEDIANEQKQITIYSFKETITCFIYFNIVNKYRTQLFHIFDKISRINVYASILPKE